MQENGTDVSTPGSVDYDDREATRTFKLLEYLGRK